MTEATHDVVIVGGGHNGLVAAAYLAKAGKSVLLLERDDHLGGAAVSAEAFSGVDARLSRYSYLVSLLPARIIAELGLDIRLAQRRYSSYTPDPADTTTGLLVDNSNRRSTRASFARVGADGDFAAWNDFYADTARVAAALFPSVCEPLPTRSEARRLLGDDALWTSFFEQPLGQVITERFDSDLVRGVVATDGLIGTFTSVDDPSLDANRCFLYHVIGNETGDWHVPIGGMGAVSGEIERAARLAGARIVTGSEVTSIGADGEVRYRRGPHERRVVGGTVLANVAPFVLDQLLAAGGAASAGIGLAAGSAGADAVADANGEAVAARPEGAQVKVNLMLSRLPKLRDATVTPEAAFGGTFHINERYSQLEGAYAEASRGVIPEVLPCEIYCHTLADPSILGPELAASGAHTLTVFALHAPDRWLTEANNDATRERLQAAVLASLNSVLAEPIEPLLLTDASGRPTIETKTTRDIEAALGMPGGHIFHGDLQWPWLEEDERPRSAAARWGVETSHPRVLLCGSGARRGGAVSGIAGHNAAHAVLEGDLDLGGA